MAEEALQARSAREAQIRELQRQLDALAADAKKREAEILRNRALN